MQLYKFVSEVIAELLEYATKTAPEHKSCRHPHGTIAAELSVLSIVLLQDLV